MRICVVSDLHFEINGYVGLSKHLKDGGDVLIVAGDMTCARFFNDYETDKREAAKRRKDIEKFLENWASKFRQCYYVLGNHDHYGAVIHESAGVLKSVFKDTNVKVLDNEFDEFDGKLFYGATMWTSFKHGDPLEMGTVQSFMNDYNLILRKPLSELTDSERWHPSRHINSGLILANDILEIHKKEYGLMLDFLEKNQDREIVMITHHAPSYSCQNIGRHGSNLIYGYCNDFDDLIFRNKNIKLWAFGHTHDSCEFKIGETLVYSNQCGYRGYESSASLFRPRFIEV